MKLVWLSALCCILTVRMCRVLESLIMEVPCVFSQKERGEPAQQGVPVSVSYLML